MMGKILWTLQDTFAKNIYSLSYIANDSLKEDSHLEVWGMMTLLYLIKTSLNRLYFSGKFILK